ncbi:flavin monoamine oxidase family protein [Actinocrispum wychmicini]|nr:NAD(P)/FAD-dependent oxidoreductase [Actinocrispum wychmicini]
MTWSLASQAFAGAPADDDDVQLYTAYEQWLRENSPGDPVEPLRNESPDVKTVTVGIVGGGHAGLYSAMLLLGQGVPGRNITVFEASDRLGGRVYTHQFKARQNDVTQYSDLGAMRLPDIPAHKIVFDVIADLNVWLAQHTKPLLKQIPYHLSAPENLISVNGRKPISVVKAETNPELLGFPASATKDESQRKHVSASGFMNLALHRFTSIKDPEKRLATILSYDNISFSQYLRAEMGWQADRINYVETVLSATGNFDRAVPEVVLSRGEFDPNARWVTLAGGLGKLTAAMADYLRAHNVAIHMTTPIAAVGETKDGKVPLTPANGTPRSFHRVILAIPTAPLRLMDTPASWAVEKKAAMRRLATEDLYKVGLQFPKRWWDSPGGQSHTDRAPWWLVYPSDPKMNTVLLYGWATDARNMATLSQDQRLKVITDAIRSLHPKVRQTDLKPLETVEVFWGNTQAGGIGHFGPGQFTDYYNIMQRNEGYVSFAGEHLSLHHGWIAGACQSALLAVSHALGMIVNPIGFDAAPPPPRTETTTTHRAVKLVT